jgi:lysophospholipase L1-like esterase
MSTTVFIGDSVTDCDRLTIAPYGNGWVKNIVDSQQLDGTIVNVGTSGHRLVDLMKRWQTDVLDHKPTRLSVAIGVNDMWRRYDDNDPTDVDVFEANYRGVLQQVLDLGPCELVLCEPFLLPVREEMVSWREDLDPKISAVHRVARDFDAKLVPFDQHLNALALTMRKEDLAGDGIHPSIFGHQVMADLWLKTVNG